MNLDTFHYVVSIPDTHYFPFLSLGSYLETGGEVVRLDDKGVITGSRERIVYILVYGFAVMIDER